VKFEYARALVASHYEHDEGRFEQTVRQLMATGKTASRQLSKYLMMKHRGVVLLPNQEEFWLPARPQLMDDLILPDSTMSKLYWIVQQRKRADELREHDLRPCSRLLLHGPPGMGKTMAACCMANELGLPALLLRSEAVVDSYLGKSAQNLRKAIEAVSQVDAVFIIDEVDSIGATRNNDSASGQELARMTNALLSLLDTTSDRCLLVATTNRFDLLDPAMARRWQRLEIRVGDYEKRELAMRNGLCGPDAKAASVWANMAELAATIDEAKRWACLHDVDLSRAFRHVVRSAG